MSLIASLLPIVGVVPGVPFLGLDDADAGIEAEAAEAVGQRRVAIERLHAAGRAGGMIGAVAVGAAMFLALVVALRTLRGAR